MHRAEQFRDERRRVAKVGVHDTDDVRGRDGEPGHHGGTETQFPGAVHHPHAPRGRELIRERTGAIRRVIVDNDQFEGKLRRVGGCKNGVHEFRQPGPFVVRGHDDRQIGRHGKTIIQRRTRMAEIDRYRIEDQRAVQALYRRVFGQDAAESSRLRWEWQYQRNPNVPSSGAPVWVAREGQTIIGQYGTIPVRLSVNGKEIDASWATDVMVVPERQRQGVGEMLLRAWQSNVGAALGLGLSESSSGLFRKLRFPSFGPVPCLVKPLSRRALRRPTWPVPINRLVSALTFPFVRLVARTKPLQGEVRPIKQFDEGFTRLWERVGPAFAGAVRRDAKYLNWRFVQPPHVRYSLAALYREGEAAGYVVYRHGQEPRGRATRLIDFFADPKDDEGVLSLLRFVDREAQAANSDKIRVYATHAGFRKLLRKSGYYPWRSSAEFVAKINAVSVDTAFYASPDGWHITAGDSDQDH